MNLLLRTAAALRELLGPAAEAAAAASGVIRRRRKFDAEALARTFVLGHLRQPAASAERLAQAAAECGVAATPQALDQRVTPALADFLERLFRHAVRTVLGGDHALAPLLERFAQVVVLDSTTLPLPDSQRPRFPGCGGSYDACQAALKLQVELDLRTAALTHVELEPGRTSDGGSTRQHAVRPPGSLRIADLGYFSVAVFREMTGRGEHFLSRLHFPTSIRRPGATAPLDLMAWLARQPPGWIDVPILLGPERLACRLIAWRMPAAAAAERRRKLRRHLRRKYRKEPSAERLAWCDWNLLVTSVPAPDAAESPTPTTTTPTTTTPTTTTPPTLTPEEAVVLYRARWQIELLFKRWKSQNLLGAAPEEDDTRQLVRMWSRLLAAVVQHWLLATAIGGDPRRSWHKVAEATRQFAGRLLSARAPGDWVRILADLQRVVSATCRRDPRRRPGTFELLNQPSLLDFQLT